ncbi:hypothetical protein VL15_04710 [Burkholderia cepacia]|uniref:Uncharacterized protein n=2 Tax=Burkholderia cepacia TaxID=292 RepID=A0A0J5X3Y7_BURCE|nr:hypothetical protein VL15_04710 [Burkholderia cepacia]
MVNGSSTEWLHAYRDSGDPGERMLAREIASAIQSGTLRLGNPASQSATRSQYGQKLQTTPDDVTIVANFRLRADGRFDLIAAFMRDSATPNSRVTITARPNAADPGTSVERQSSDPLQPAAPAFSAQVSQGMNRIVNELARWDQRTARTRIETKLRSVPADQQHILLMHLNKQLSGSASNAKPSIIQTWAENTSVDTVIAERDMRTDRERELQNAIATQNRDPRFTKPRDEILAMLSPAERKAAAATSINGRTKYRSPLYFGVFRDSRGPVAAINDIRALIETIPEYQRLQAIVDWDPK